MRAQALIVMAYPMSPPTSASPASMPMQTRYPRKACRAARQLPVAAQVHSGTIDSRPATAAMNRRA